MDQLNAGSPPKTSESSDSFFKNVPYMHQKKWSTQIIFSARGSYLCGRFLRKARLLVRWNRNSKGGFLLRLLFFKFLTLTNLGAGFHRKQDSDAGFEGAKRNQLKFEGEIRFDWFSRVGFSAEFHFFSL